MRSIFARGAQILFYTILIAYAYGSDAIAAVHYASPSGSASWSSSSNKSTPCSAATAFANANGDTVRFLDGTYNLPSSVFVITNSNAVFTSDSQDPSKVIFNCNLATLPNVRAQFQVKGDNVTFSYIHFNYVGTAIAVTDSGSGDNLLVSHNTARGLGGDTDNSGFVVLSGACSRADNATIEYNTIQGPGTGVNSNNACLYLTMVRGAVVQNNELYNAPKGIYLKHSNPDDGSDHPYIINNYLHDVSIGISAMWEYATISNNLFVDTGLDMGNNGGSGCNGARGCKNNIIEHNTFYNSSSGSGTMAVWSNQSCTYNTSRYNLFYRAPNQISRYQSSMYAGWTFDYNLYPTGTVVVGPPSSTSYSLSSWRSYTGQDSHSLSATPVFVGGSSPSSISGFALASNSPGYQAAPGGQDMGADVSSVGPGGTGTIGGGSSGDTGGGSSGDTGGGSSGGTGTAPNTPIVVSVESTTEQLGSAVIFQDDFEDGLTMGQKYADYNANNGDTAPIATQGFGGSAHALRGRWQQGQTGAGSFAYFFGRNPAGSQSNSSTDFREIYWRLYVKNSEGWTGNPRKLTRATIMATSSWAQGMIAHVWGESGDPGLDIDPASGIDGNGNLATTTYNDFNGLSWLGIRRGTTPIYATNRSNTWYCVEAHVKLNTPGQSDGVFEIWIDGNLEVSRSDLNWVGTWQDYGINAIMFANHWNDGSPRAQERYMDNIVISTQRIGLAGSPANPKIYKSQFSDSDSGDNQSAVEAQVSTSAGTSGMVWSGQNASANDYITVDSTNGSFSGSLSGQNSLASGTYYARVRQSDAGGNVSGWSAWKIFKVSGTVATPQNLRIVTTQTP